MRRAAIGAALAALAGAAVLAAVWRPDKTMRVVTGFAAHALCSQTFVSGFDPKEIFAQTIAPYPGTQRLARGLFYRVDRVQKTVEVDWHGLFASHAVWRAGLGCMIVAGAGASDQGRAQTAPSAPPLLREIAGPQRVGTGNPALRAALENFFVAPPQQRWIKAVVVVKDGHVIAEKYAPGVGVDTPLAGYSASKSIINALVGILVGDGRLAVGAPAPVAAWQGPGDPRARITLDNLLRMTSGLAIAQTGSGFDPASRMLYTERDMAGFAERAAAAEPPGTAMRYSDTSTLIVSRLVRDAVGGSGAAVQSFARRRLFGPLGMTNIVMEADATGTPVGSSHFFATARDWARLGILYLDDGVVGGHRLLPAGWVRYATTPTLGTSYGAGFWTNAGRDEGALGRVAAGVPADTFFASGNLGQRVYVIASAGLVIVRLGVTQAPDFDIRGDNRLIRNVLAATAR